MEALVAEMEGAARHRELADHFDFASEMVGERANIKRRFKPRAPVCDKIGDEREKRGGALAADGEVVAFGSFDRGTNEARLDG